MHQIVKTYDPASGHLPVEGQDYRVLSLSDIHRRAMTERKKMMAFAFSTVFVDVGIAAGGSVLRQFWGGGVPPLELIFIVPVAAYSGVKTFRHKALGDTWDRVANILEQDEKTHILYLNPELEKGGEADVYPSTTLRRGHDIIQHRLIPQIVQYEDRIVPVAATPNGPQL